MTMTDYWNLSITGTLNDMAPIQMGSGWW